MSGKGYIKSTERAWRKYVKNDVRKNDYPETRARVKMANSKGYTRNSVFKYNLKDDCTCKYITDYDYLYMGPFNTMFGKWLEDMLTTRRVLIGFEKHFRNVYFNLERRNWSTLVFRTGDEDRRYTADDVLATLQEKQVLELRPTFWESNGRRYTLEYENGNYYVNGTRYTDKRLKKLLLNVTRSYVVADPVNLKAVAPSGIKKNRFIKLWLANDAGDEAKLLSATINATWVGTKTDKKYDRTALIDLETGAFNMVGEEEEVIENWAEIKGEILRVAEAIPQISYFSVSIAPSEENLFTFLHFSRKPILPRIAFHDELNDYLLERAQRIAEERNPVFVKTLWGKLKSKVKNKVIKKLLRPGIRPYMGELWIKSVWSDFLHTKLSLSKKIWAWKRGFISYHTYQYGITEENYQTFLSDFDYYWLNRINGVYQGWVNDKTTYRYTMNNFPECSPKYYFSLFRYSNGDKTMQYRKMPDCPAGIENGFDGFLQLLRQEKILAVKPSAGTHGDGFYCMRYEDGKYFANSDEYTEEGLRELMDARQSFYVVTEYLVMHDKLKAIYPKSVNTVRVMVINKEGYNPQIMQTYMRIGSSTTGFTDNVGYGGICVMIDSETGELIEPQTISEHIYYDCPNHPDTGTPIAGILPNWDILRETALNVARSMPELEYLGFDITITQTGVQILEINIHQDLHKANTFSPEIMEFFNGKIKRKKATLGIKE